MALPTSWNFEPLLSGDADPRIPELEAQLRARAEGFVTAWKDRSDYLESAGVLREALDQYELLQRQGGTSGTIGYYFGLRGAQDQGNSAVQAGFNRIHELSTALDNDLSFFELRLAAVKPEKLAAFAAAPELEPYRHFLEGLALSAPYLLSEPEEKILSLKSLTSRSNWVKLTSKLLFAEEREALTEAGAAEKATFEGLLTLTESRKKEVRDSAAVGINDILRTYLAVAEAELNSVLADKKTNDELRGLPRPDASRLLSDDVDAETVDGLLASVEARFDLPRRFYALKAKLLGLDKLSYHERNVEYGELTAKYPYDEAVALVRETFAALDPEFASILDLFTQNGQVDVFPKPGKQGGAFCAMSAITDPVYILLNHGDSLNDVLTLAHEAGHGINDELIRQKQHALYFGTPMSTAEVASTFMEDFVLDKLLKTADDERRLAILMMKLNSDMSTIFRQVACYRFEQELHQTFRSEHYLDAAAIGKIFLKHMSAYMGEAVELSDGAENWWAYWSHIRSFFYVYSYASGLLISKSLQASVQADPGFISNVKEFLSAGTSASPRDIFKKLGIDIADTKFWEAGIGRVEKLLEETEELARKLGRL